MSTDSVELDEIHSVNQDDKNEKGNDDNHDENRFSKRPKSLFSSARKKSFRKQQQKKEFTNIFPCPKSVDLTSPEFGSVSSLGIVSSLVSTPSSASIRRLRMARRKTRSVALSNYQPNHGKRASLVRP